MYASTIPISFLLPSVQSLMLHQPILWSIVTKGQCASIQSFHEMLCQWRCASGSADSWSVCGENGEWWVVIVGAVTKCSSQTLPMDQSIAFIPRLMETQQRNPPLYHHRAWHMCNSNVKRHSLINRMLKVSAQTVNERNRATTIRAWNEASGQISNKHELHPYR